MFGGVPKNSGRFAAKSVAYAEIFGGFGNGDSAVDYGKLFDEEEEEEEEKAAAESLASLDGRFLISPLLCAFYCINQCLPGCFLVTEKCKKWDFQELESYES